MSGRVVVRHVSEVGRFFLSEGFVEAVSPEYGQIWVKIPVFRPVGVLTEKKAAALSERTVRQILRNAGLLSNGYDFKLTATYADLAVGLMKGSVIMSGWVLDDKGSKVLHIPASLEFHKEKRGNVVDLLRLDFDVGALACYLRYHLKVEGTLQELLESFKA